MNKCFVKDQRPDDPPGKGSFWKIHPDFADSFDNIETPEAAKALKASIIKYKKRQSLPLKHSEKHVTETERRRTVVRINYDENSDASDSEPVEEYAPPQPQQEPIPSPRVNEENSWFFSVFSNMHQTPPENYSVEREKLYFNDEQFETEYTVDADPQAVYLPPNFLEDPFIYTQIQKSVYLNQEAEAANVFSLADDAEFLVVVVDNDENSKTN